ncbi:MAG TPA: cache and HAMP domain-containing protein, partial [Devosia sp.]
MGLIPNLKIARKLPLAVLGSALLVGLGIGGAAYLVGASAVTSQRDQALQASANSSLDLVTNYFDMVDVDLRLFAGRGDTVTATEGLVRGYAELSMGANAMEVLQKVYVASAATPEERRAIDNSSKAGTYDSPHKRFHPGFRALLEGRGYADILLLSPAGEVVYSVNKNPDFGTIVAGGNDGLAQVFTAALAQPAGSTSFVDFTSYAPAGGAATAFLGSPLFKGDKLVGVMAFAISTEGLSARLQNVRGLGETGEVLIVGKDGLLRNDSRFTGTNDALVQTVGPEVLSVAGTGTASAATSESYRQVPLFVLSVPYSFMGTEWDIVAVKSADEAFAPIGEMRNMMVIIGAGLLLVVAALGYLFSRTITRPISRLTTTMERLAEGELETEVVGANRTDELGAMAKAVEVFKLNALKVT